MLTVQVAVTAADAHEAPRTNCLDCAVARATRRALQHAGVQLRGTLSVTGASIRVYEDARGRAYEWRAPLPREVRDWIAAFDDNRHHTLPLPRFELDVPETEQETSRARARTI